MQAGWRALIVNAVSRTEQAADDKESMKHQLESNTAICDHYRWEVIDVIDIPGYSRNFLTLRELVEAASADGEHGPARLEAHILARDFDVMVVRITNRFNREQSLNAEIITRVVRMGGRIYSQADGLIDESNYRAIIAITGFRDAGEIDELKRRRWIGLLARAAKGLPVGGHVPDSHRIVYNTATGEAERIELREEFFPIWRDLVTVLLEGVGYNQIEQEMFRRFRHGKDGEPYAPGKFSKLLFKPYFWGNNVIRKRSVVSSYVEGLWAFDSSETPPSGVYVFYGTHEPVYKGETARRVQAELRRRTGTQNGAGARFGISMFTNLVLCDDCHAYFGYQRKRVKGEIVYTYLRCYRENYEDYSKRVFCRNRRHIREEVIKTWLDKRLRQWLEVGGVSFEIPDESSQALKHVENLRRAIARLQTRLDRLIEETLEADADLRLDYRKRIRTTKDDLLRAREHLQAEESQLQQHAAQHDIQQGVLNNISAQGVDEFWAQSPIVINQQLHALLGHVRLVVRDARIVGYIDARLR